MSVEDVRKALKIARHFIEWDSNGPHADLWSFKAISAELDEGKNRWVVVCQFTKDNETYKAKLEIDVESENILSYKIIE